MQCGLLGRKLSHSYSPQIHKALGGYPYDLFEKEPEELEEFLLHGNFTGLNVTIPYKKAVIPYCKELSPRARVLGAVNTLVRRSDGSLIGHNTDYYGFRSLVDRTGISFRGKKALVLGSGGASVTAVAVLEEIGANAVTVSRSGENHYGNLERHADAALIVNATPVGMYPHNGTSPIDLNLFPKLECVLDLIYNPARTALLQQADELGIPNANGLWMLVAQAKESAEWFLDKELSNDHIGSIYEGLRNQMENVILIGMPGSGKTTIGKILAERTGRKYADTDESVIQSSGVTVPEIFASQGEEGFRTLETEAVARLGKESGLVIATGGGCVTRKENYPHLHQNGRIFWLKRDLSLLPTDGRPLSQTRSLTEMYREREPLYQAFCDHCIDNNGSAEDTAQQILYFLNGGNGL